MHNNPPATILIVDDTPENLTVLRDMLSRDGHKVRPVLQGEMALRIAHTDPPDLILLDVLMPGLNGYETCTRLKADPLTRDCPVLFISALDTTADKVRGFEAGGLDYITKPFREAEVLARVRTHLSLRAAQQKLKAQNEELAAAAALREDVDRILRHDLRGPLANIIAFSGLIADAAQATQPQLAEHAKVISSAAYSTLSMIHSSFDLIRMERGTYITQAESFDLLEVLHQISQEMALAAGQKSLKLQLTPAPNTQVKFMVTGERLLTRSLFYNLVKNAIEASPPSGQINLQLSPAQTASHIQVSVHNAGAVPESIREHFFDKYVTSGKVGGSGLGTYSARLMAQTQAGSIHLDTSQAGFTTLTVLLPGSREFVTAAENPAAEHAELANLRLLIADDDPANRTYIAHLLPASANIIWATDGTQALEALCSQQSEVALLDIEMPGLTGLEVVKNYLNWRQTQNPPPPRTRLIALTGHQDETVHQLCLSAGFDEVLTKPPGKTRLRQALSQTRLQPKTVVEIDNELAELIPDFLKTRQAAITQLSKAIEEGDHQNIVFLAHRLQGSLGMYGFTEASRLATAIERLKTDETGQARELLQLLEAHLARLEIRYVQRG